MTENYSGENKFDTYLPVVRIITFCFHLINLYELCTFKHFFYEKLILLENMPFGIRFMTSLFN